MASSREEEVPYRELGGGSWLHHVVWGVLAVTHLRHWESFLEGSQRCFPSSRWFCSPAVHLVSVLGVGDWLWRKNPERNLSFYPQILLILRI